MIGCEGQGDLQPRLLLSRMRETIAGVCEAAHQRQLRCLSSADMSQEPIWVPLASALPLSGSRVPVQAEGKTHTKGTEPVQV